MNYEALIRNITINHARNRGELVVWYKDPITGKRRCYYADGFDEVNWTIYEFHGCDWHGCHICHTDPNEVNPRVESGATYGELLHQTLAREAHLRRMGYGLVVKWSHEWDDMHVAVAEPGFDIESVQE
jgi:hypothetical protein